MPEINQRMLAVASQGKAIVAIVANGADITITDDIGRNVFHLLAARGASENIKEAFCCAGAKEIIDSPDNFGETPLHHAAKNGHTAAALALLMIGADLKAKNKDSDTPLQLAETAERKLASTRRVA